jgi:hypothetical protein
MTYIANDPHSPAPAYDPAPAPQQWQTPPSRPQADPTPPRQPNWWDRNKDSVGGCAKWLIPILIVLLLCAACSVCGWMNRGTLLTWWHDFTAPLPTPLVVVTTSTPVSVDPRNPVNPNPAPESGSCTDVLNRILVNPSDAGNVEIRVDDPGIQCVFYSGQKSWKDGMLKDGKRIPWKISLPGEYDYFYLETAPSGGSCYTDMGIKQDSACNPCDDTTKYRAIVTQNGCSATFRADGLTYVYP